MAIIGTYFNQSMVVIGTICDHKMAITGANCDLGLIFFYKIHNLSMAMLNLGFFYYYDTIKY